VDHIDREVSTGAEEGRMSLGLTVTADIVVLGASPSGLTQPTPRRWPGPTW
jgi:hypothetical protein